MNRINFRLIFVLIVLIGSLYILFTQPITLGLDLRGGSRLVLKCLDTEKVKVNEDAVRGVVEVIRNRIDALGVTEPVIQRKGNAQVVVELPGIKDPQRAIQLIGETALLSFVEAEWVNIPVEKLTSATIQDLYGEGARLAYTREVVNGKKTKGVPIILKDAMLTGDHLKSAHVDFDQYSNPVVGIEFDSEGGRIFGEVTARHKGKPLAILLDQQVISAPRVNEAILGGRAQISGNFTIDEVKDLVIKLKAGALPVPVEIVENKNIGATLGKDSLEKSKVAGIIGSLAVLFFMVGYYRLPGFIANIALVIYTISVLAALILLKATLTLPGIAGFILSIGMAVDANIIIFERLKEELRQHKILKTAVDLSFKRAFNAILDGNVTVLIAAAVLFQLGTGSIKGFALTLTVGTLITMFSAVFATKTMLDMVVNSQRVKSTSSLFLR